MNLETMLYCVSLLEEEEDLICVKNFPFFGQSSMVYGNQTEDVLFLVDEN